jgi:hypothetical protein
MDSNHDKVIQSHLCYRYTTRQKGGKFAYHIVGKSQAKGMTDDKSQMTDWEGPATRKVGGRPSLIRKRWAAARRAHRPGRIQRVPKNQCRCENPLGHSGASPHQVRHRRYLLFARSAPPQRLGHANSRFSGAYL